MVCSDLSVLLLARLHELLLFEQVSFFFFKRLLYLLLGHSTLLHRLHVRLQHAQLGHIPALLPIVELLHNPWLHQRLLQIFFSLNPLLILARLRLLGLLFRLHLVASPLLQKLLRFGTARRFYGFV